MDEPPTNPRTSIRDAILASVSPGLDEDAVKGVEWAAVEDTRISTYAGRFPPWDMVNPDNWRSA